MPTKIVTHMFTPQSRIEDGVDSVVNLATNNALENTSGKYFDRKKEAKALSQAYDDRARKQLVALSEKLTGI